MSAIETFVSRLFHRQPTESTSNSLYSEPHEWLSLDLIYEQAKSQLEAQSTLWEAADGRLRLVLGVIGIIFAASLAVQPRGFTYALGVGQVVVATGPVSTQETWSYPSLLPSAVGVLVILSVVMYLVAGLIAARAYWPSKFDRPPDLSLFRDDYLNSDPRRTKLRLVDTIIAAYAKNQVRLELKFNAFKQAFRVTAIATAFLAAGVIIQVAFETTALPSFGG